MPSQHITRQQIILAVAAIALIIIVFVVGRVSVGSATAQSISLTPTPTRIIPTPTPKLTLQSPHVLAGWQSSNAYLQCTQCNQLSFTSHGPFDILIACNPFQVFADSLPAVELQLYDGNGHLIDTVQKSCGDPNKDTVVTAVIPEALAAGQYQLTVNAVTTAPIAVLILDATQA